MLAPWPAGGWCGCLGCSCWGWFPDKDGGRPPLYERRERDGEPEDAEAVEAGRVLRRRVGEDSREEYTISLYNNQEKIGVTTETSG